MLNLTRSTAIQSNCSPPSQHRSSIWTLRKGPRPTANITISPTHARTLQPEQPSHFPSSIMDWKLILSISALYYLPPAESCHFSTQSDCSHKNIVRDWKVSLASSLLRTCHFDSLGLHFYCTVEITANRLVLKRQLNVHEKKKKVLASESHTRTQIGPTAISAVPKQWII